MQKREASSGEPLTSPAAERNSTPILAVLQRVLPSSGLVLEIASGTGQHAARFSRALAHLTWQPSDADARSRDSIAAWCAKADVPNLREPLALDVRVEPWPIAHADAIVCINMIHISPWAATIALFAGAQRVLGAGGVVYLYGPYRVGRRHTAPSNEAFDRSLRAQDAAWGVRDLEDVMAVASDSGFDLVETVEMPANNLSLVFGKR